MSRDFQGAAKLSALIYGAAIMPTSNSPYLLSSILQKASDIPAKEAYRLAAIFSHYIQDLADRDTDTPKLESVQGILQTLSNSMEALRLVLKKEAQERADQALAADEKSGEWLTIGEILTKNLPGLPKSRSTLKAYLDESGITADPYLCRKREYTSRGIEYHRSALTRKAITERKKWFGVDIDGLLPWIATTLVEQPNLTPSGLREAYKLHLRATGNKGNVPSLRGFRQAIKYLSREGR